MTDSLSGSLCLVTGIAGNLGPIWARGLLDQGARVVGLAYPGTELNRELDSIRGPRLSLVGADVTRPRELRAAVDRIVEEHGVPDVLVVNAGLDRPPTANTEASDDARSEFSRFLDVNLIGAFSTLQMVGEAMALRGRGSIILIGSLYASVSPDPSFYNHLDAEKPFRKPVGYSVSKAGLIGMARYYAVHWASRGVRVNALSPGGVYGTQDAEFVRKFSARVPLGRMARPEELIGPLLFLASDASSYVTGSELRVDGGFTAL